MNRLDYDVSKIVDIVRENLNLNLKEPTINRLIEQELDAYLSDAVDDVYNEGFGAGYERAKSDYDL